MIFQTALTTSHNALEFTSPLSIPVNIHLGLFPLNLFNMFFSVCYLNVTLDNPQSGLKGSSSLFYNLSICIYPCSPRNRRMDCVLQNKKCVMALIHVEMYIYFNQSQVLILQKDSSFFSYWLYLTIILKSYNQIKQFSQHITFPGSV